MLLACPSCERAYPRQGPAACPRCHAHLLGFDDEAQWAHWREQRAWERLFALGPGDRLELARATALRDLGFRPEAFRGMRRGHWHVVFGVLGACGLLFLALASTELARPLAWEGRSPQMLLTLLLLGLPALHAAAGWFAGPSRFARRFLVGRGAVANGAAYVGLGLAAAAAMALHGGGVRGAAVGLGFALLGAVLVQKGLRDLGWFLPWDLAATRLH